MCGSTKQVKARWTLSQLNSIVDSAEEDNGPTTNLGVELWTDMPGRSGIRGLARVRPHEVYIHL